MRITRARAPHTLRAALRRCGARLWGSCASARLLGLGAAVRGVGRRAALLLVGLGAPALAERALLRRLSGRLRWVGAGFAWLARGSMRSGKSFGGGAAWVPPLVSELPYPDIRALRLFLVSARLLKGAARVWVCLRLGAAVLGSARRQTARGRVGTLAHTPASGWRVCIGSGGARAAALALRALTPGPVGLGLAGAGLDAPWEACAAARHGCYFGASEPLPFPGRRAPRRLQAVRCGFCKVRRASERAFGAVSGSERRPPGAPPQRPRTLAGLWPQTASTGRATHSLTEPSRSLLLGHSMTHTGRV